MVYINPGPYLECQSSSQITASYDELGWRWPMEWCNELQNNSNPKPGKKKSILLRQKFCSASAHTSICERKSIVARKCFCRAEARGCDKLPKCSRSSQLLNIRSLAKLDFGGRDGAHSGRCRSPPLSWSVQCHSALKTCETDPIKVTNKDKCLWKDWSEMWNKGPLSG